MCFTLYSLRVLHVHIVFMYWCIHVYTYVLSIYSHIWLKGLKSKETTTSPELHNIIKKRRKNTNNTGCTRNPENAKTISNVRKIKKQWQSHLTILRSPKSQHFQTHPSMHTQRCGNAWKILGTPSDSPRKHIAQVGNNHRNIHGNSPDNPRKLAHIQELKDTFRTHSKHNQSIFWIY